MTEPLRRILLLGRHGQLGWELQRTLAPLGEVTATGHRDLDIGDPRAIRDCVREVRPQLIVNAAAYTAVDRAEREPDVAFAVNATAPGVLAEEARRIGALLVHYSTDYVFDGRKYRPYAEEDDPEPLNTYGRSKLEGERQVTGVGGRHLIIRTSWIYGLRGNNFLRTMLRLLHEQTEVHVVADQIGAPTWSRMIAEATAQVLAADIAGMAAPAGVYHLSAAGQTTWHGFAAAIQAAVPSARASVVPVSTDDRPTPAVRPRYSVLANERIQSVAGIRLPHWEASLKMLLLDSRG